MEIPQALKHFLSLLHPEVRSNLKVTRPSNYPTPYGLRIDVPPNPKDFWPRMPSSAAPSEDQTVPRVITASTLVGCMNGATYVIQNAFDRRGGEFSCDNFYHISAFPFEYALLPNNELVYDAADTQEQWLVSYDKATRFYRPFQIGEIFVHSITSDMLPNAKVNVTNATAYMAVFKNPGIAVTQGKVLIKGFYKLEFDLTRYIAKKVRRMSFLDDSLVKVEEISAEVYNGFRAIGVKKGL